MPPGTSSQRGRAIRPPELDWKVIELLEDPARLSSIPAVSSPDAQPAFELLYGDEQRK